MNEIFIFFILYFKYVIFNFPLLSQIEINKRKLITWRDLYGGILSVRNKKNSTHSYFIA